MGRGHADADPDIPHGDVPPIDEFNPADPDGVWTLYEGPRICRCHDNWVDRMPDDVKFHQDLDDNEDTDQEHANTYAIVVRKRRDHNNGFIPRMHLQDITIQSSLLVKALRNLFGDYSGIDLTSDTPLFNAPFVPFFHYWTRWRDAIAIEKDERTLLHMKLLDAILQEELAPAFAAKAKALEERVISFEYLWTLFELGDILFTQRGGGLKRLYQLASVSNGHNQLHLNCLYSEYDGHVFGRLSHGINIDQFTGTKHIDALKVRPLSLIKDPDSIVSELRKRGERVRELAGINCMDHDGDAWTDHRNTVSKGDRIKLKGRIIVDADAMLQSGNGNYLSGSVEEWNSDWSNTATPTDSDWDGRLHTTEDMQICLTTPFVRGWSLALHRWLTFDIDNVQWPKWDKDAFSHLSLPADFRELIQATVEMQLSQPSRFDDIISGKGKGFVLLFSGSQGVGKTATVETIAEALQAPLYVITASQLGTKPQDIEKRLGETLERAARWQAVLLLDEADIWVQRRDGGNMQRNAIVTIFLRMLEYHQGVLCMTTNRSSAIDPAIHSRIHLSLRFPNLGPEAREQVWRHFAKRAADALLEEEKSLEDTSYSNDGNDDANDSDMDEDTEYSTAPEQDKESHDSQNDANSQQSQVSILANPGSKPSVSSITDAQFRELAAVELDGRQIKNAFKTAVLLAQWKGRSVDFASLQQSVRILEQQIRAQKVEERELEQHERVWR